MALLSAKGSARKVIKKEKNLSWIIITEVHVRKKFSPYKAIGSPNFFPSHYICFPIRGMCLIKFSV